jgi:hypothetical protein
MSVAAVLCFALPRICAQPSTRMNSVAYCHVHICPCCLICIQKVADVTAIHPLSGGPLGKYWGPQTKTKAREFSRPGTRVYGPRRPPSSEGGGAHGRSGRVADGAGWGGDGH